MAKDKITLERLAEMIAAGFEATASKAEVKELRQELQDFRKDVDERFKHVDDRFDASDQEVRDMRKRVEALERTTN